MPIDSKLIFTGPPSGGRLVFGEADEVTIPAVGLSADADFGPGDPATAAELPTDGRLLWDAGVSRGERYTAPIAWQDAQRVGARAQQVWQDAQRFAHHAATRWQDGAAIGARAAQQWTEAQHLRARAVTRWQDGVGQRSNARADWQEGQRMRAIAAARWQDGSAMRHTTRNDWQETVRLRHLAAARWQDGSAMRRETIHSGAAGIPVRILAATRWQDAMRPPAGVSQPLVPIVPPLEPCYDPAALGRLVFTDAWVQGDGRLVFVCIRGDEPGPGATVIVPVRSVYMTINSFSLKRLDNDYPIMANSMSLSLDVDSWTWTCSFSVNGSALPTVARNSNGDPVVARATINGTPIDFLLERISRDRSFGSSQLRVQGRGLSAQLDDPYAPVLTFGNPSSARTARQLLDDILTINGVSNGWGISAFDPTDWYVPAGVFAHQGSYISAMNQVVGSVGAYLQPQDTGQNMDVRMRYPTPSWEWSGATPDIVLPSAVTSQEGIDWVNKPDYSRVFVVGQENGVLGRYTREGTDGAILAPGVVDPLITHVDAVRQRGRTILSQTGTMANVTLRLPVLAETGIIRPGKMVRYTDDGVTRIGMTRSVGVDVAMPTIYQTIEVETYV